MNEHTGKNASDEEASPGRSTIAFYEGHAQEYFDRTVSADLGPLYGRFLQYVKPGGRVLDLGSGSGRDLKALRDRGYATLGIDASPSLAKLAAAFSGVPCLTMRFEDLNFDSEFDAVWACASLLHVSKRKLPSILERIRGALVANGALFLSVQAGEGEKLLPDGRFFSYYMAQEFHQFVEDAGFSLDQCWFSKDTLNSHRSIDWLNVIAKRKADHFTSQVGL
jgi:SAM-dependent methyltransferase